MEEVLFKLFPTISSQKEERRKSNINSKFLENIEKVSSIEKFNQNLVACGGKLERIQLAQQYFDWIVQEPEILAKYSKSAEVSTILRDKANQLYSAKKYKEALQFYNFSLLYAIPENENMGLVYANRSATLMIMKDAKAALNDIELAIKNKYPKKLMKKLEDRRTKCHEILQENVKIAEGDDSIKKCDADRDRRKKFCERILFCVKQPNQQMPAAENFVQVRVDPNKGRQLVVTKDIPAGTVLTVEQPYVSILKNSLKWDIDHCHFCLKRIYCGIPCNNCVFAIYCDENCREKADKEFHHFECPCLPQLKCDSTPRYIRLSLSIIFKLGPNNLLSIFQNQMNCDADGIYDSNSYTPIYQLVSHSSKLDPLDIYSNTLNSLILTRMVDECTDFFSDVNPAIKPSFMTFVASMIVHHLENVPFNSIALEELEGLEGLSLLETRSQDSKKLEEMIRFIKFPQFAAGVYAVSSLLNHSCDPNVTRVFDVQNGTLSIIATRALKMNEEILTCYTQSFIKDDVSSRRQYLLENYHFSCQCIACQNSWPELSDIMLNSPVFCCDKCSVQFYYDEKSDENFRKCILLSPHHNNNEKNGNSKKNGGTSSVCGSCGQTYSGQELNMQLDKNIELFFQAYSLVVNNFPLDAIRNLVGPLKYFQSHICPPYSKYYMAQGIYKQALELIVFYSK